MSGRLLRVTGTVLVMAVAFVTPVLVTSAPASADIVINGCTMVASPTPLNFTNCPGANLSGVNLSDFNLNYANLTGANLTGANLTGASLWGTLLVPSDQIVAATSPAGAVVTWPTPPSLPGATPGSCSAAPAIEGSPSGSTFPIGTIIVTCQVIDDQGDIATAGFTVTVTPSAASLPCKKLASCNLSGFNLGNAYLAGANLKGANLMGINFSGANLFPFNVSGANLSGANLMAANLSGANLSGADLTGANLTGADLTGANLSGASVTADTNFNNVIWGNTTCPDGMNSDNDGGTCVGHL